MKVIIVDDDKTSLTVDLLRYCESRGILVEEKFTSTNTLRDAISALRDLVSEVDYHKESVCYQTDHLAYCLTRAKDVLKQHP